MRNFATFVQKSVEKRFPNFRPNHSALCHLPSLSAALGPLRTRQLDGQAGNQKLLGKVTLPHILDALSNFRPQIPGEIVVLVFLLGTPASPSQQMAIEREAKKEGDMIQGDFKDSYRHLAYKNVMGKLWASRFCPQAEFVVKSDDDM